LLLRMRKSECRRAMPPADSAFTWPMVAIYVTALSGRGGGTGPHLAPNPLPFEAFAGQVRRPANAMPPYTTVVLSDGELADIYAYLLTIPPLPDPKAAAILDR
jgi:hypothetical protein